MRNRYTHLASLALAAAATLALAVPASALPVINGVVTSPRVFNDCGLSTLNINNSWPGMISIHDVIDPACVGGANLHTWSYSTDLVNKAEFQNGDHFQHGADLVINGTGNSGEAGLRISPWWSPDVDGRFNVRIPDGEIAVFGGRLPFYSFTAAHGLSYVKGTTIRLDMIYWPNGNSQFSAGAIEYRVGYNSNTYSSGLIHFDQGNPGEDPPHGLWGILTPAYVGGYMQIPVAPNPGLGIEAVFTNFTMTQTPTEAKSTSWGRIKQLYR